MHPSIYSIIFIIVFPSVTAAFTDPANANSPRDFLNAHNRARAEVGLRPLEWNNTVAKYALSYAQKRSGDCKMEHSDGPYGENLAEGYGSFSGVDAVGMWVGEKKNYDHSSNSCAGGEVCGHYTQVVWNETASLGCARVGCRNGMMMFVICSYYPPGNYIGTPPY